MFVLILSLARQGDELRGREGWTSSDFDRDRVPVYLTGQANVAEDDWGAKTRGDLEPGREV